MNRLLVATLVFFIAFAPNDARKANEAYERGEFATAAELYRTAIQSDPDNARLYFNLGNSLAKMGQTEEAQQAYEQYKNLTDNPQDQALADYNIGNLLSDSQQLDKAAEYYRQALMGNPDDEDAKHNYELAIRQLQQQEQQQQNQDQQQDQEEDQDQQQEQEQRQDQDQEQQQDQNQDQQQDSGDTSEDQQEMESPMSLEEAQSILDALEQRERDLLRDREKEAQQENSENERDW